MNTVKSRSKIDQYRLMLYGDFISMWVATEDYIDFFFDIYPDKIKLFRGLSSGHPDLFSNRSIKTFSSFGRRL